MSDKRFSIGVVDWTVHHANRALSQPLIFEHMTLTHMAYELRASLDAVEMLLERETFSKYDHDFGSYVTDWEKFDKKLQQEEKEKEGEQ